MPRVPEPHSFRDRSRRPGMEAAASPLSSRPRVTRVNRVDQAGHLTLFKGFPELRSAMAPTWGVLERVLQR